MDRLKDILKHKKGILEEEFNKISYHTSFIFKEEVNSKILGEKVDTNHLISFNYFEKMDKVNLHLIFLQIENKVQKIIVLKQKVLVDIMQVVIKIEKIHKIVQLEPIVEVKGFAFILITLQVHITDRVDFQQIILKSTRDYRIIRISDCVENCIKVVDFYYIDYIIYGSYDETVVFFLL